ncbi:MAG TPA: Asd/ArgC dimerization domain-containing protein [Candidatus Kapabacteria bacterium]|nr:Asd/ArgC dimerization domain-containing protein [Candidatus Kapabacteria bacterium]
MTDSRLAIVGVTGEVGRAVLSRLEDSDLAFAEVHALASSRSEDETVMFRQRPLIVESADGFDFSRADFVVLATPASVSLRLAEQALAAGCRVVDHSSAYTDQASVPLAGTPDAESADLVSVPMAEVSLLAPLLGALAGEAGLRVAHVTMLLPVSSSGHAGVKELAGQTGELLNGRGIEPSVFPVQTAFNTLPLVGSEREDAVTEGLQQLLGEHVPLVLSSVIVPVFYGLTAQVTLETEVPLLSGAAIDLLSRAEGVDVKNSNEDQQVATPITDAAGQSAIYVCGVRELPAPLCGITLTAVADNVHQGAARRTVDLLEKWIKRL